MHIVLLVLLILFVIGFIASRTEQGKPYSWFVDVVGALLLIGLALLILGYAHA